MKAIARIAILCAVIVAAGLTVAAIFKPELLRSHQAIDGVQTEGLRTNNVIHQVWDSRLNPYANGTNTFIFWLDDSRILFAADKEPKPAKLNDTWVQRPWLFLWQLGEKPRPHGNDPGEASGFYRAARGEVCFQQQKIGPTPEESEALMKGPPGKERETAPWNMRQKGLPLNGVPGDIETIDCDQYVDPAMVGRAFTTDSRRKYYLDRASDPPGLPPTVGENPVLMRSDGSDRQTLPIPPEEVGSIYSRAFDDVFWILESSYAPGVRGGGPIDSYQKWKTTNCLAVWRVDPASGSTERRCIPYGPWSGREYGASGHGSPLISLVPTANGLFFTSTDYADGSAKRVGASGLYKLENATAQRVLGGYLQHATPSPSGCRVAFVYGPNWESHAAGTPGAWTIAAVDVCRPEPAPKIN